MKKFLKYSGLLVLVIIGYFGYTNYQKMVLISGFSAKNVASGVFVADRIQESIEQSDNNFSPVNWASNKIIGDKVISSVFGLQKRTAVYREGVGAVVTNKDYDPSKPHLIPKRNLDPIYQPFPYGDLPERDTVFSNIDYSKLQKIVDTYFYENNAQATTKALLIIYKNQLIIEKYGDGIDKYSKFLGWSMTKSLMSGVIGAMQKDGLININDPAPIDAWKNDERSKITINNLLQMNSGLAWEEDYTKISDVTKMLYLDSDMTASIINKPLNGEPNKSWYYSSGSTNVLSGIMRKKFKTHQEYLDYWYTNFIDKLGMRSMLVETDLAGNYIASAYGWATARDWAKFGLLYLNKGNWNGEQIFSEDWVKYTATPTNTSEGIYGAQFWLNAGGHLPDAPKDMFFADGYQGQRIFIIPSKELVIVRLGVNYSNMSELLKSRPVKQGENKDVVEFELGNRYYNNLLKNILSTIK